MPNNNLPSPSEILGTGNALPSPSEILGDDQKKKSLLKTEAGTIERPGVSSLPSKPGEPYSPLKEQSKSQLESVGATSKSEGTKSEFPGTKFELPEAAKPAKGSLYNLQQLSEIEKQSNSELKSHVRNEILSEDNKLNTKEGIDAYANKLRLSGYSKGTTEQLKDYATKVSQAAPQIKELSEELKKNPDNRDALFNLGSISLKTGDYQFAANAFKQVLSKPEEAEQQPSQGIPFPKKTTNAGALYGLGQATEKLGN
jgi:tetratricopeptide (TPR) repeat protein